MSTQEILLEEIKHQPEPVLREAHAKGALVICLSEGGLFEYGSDSEIETNLKVLRTSVEVLAVVGSVTRADEPAQHLHKTSAAAKRSRIVVGMK